MINIKSQSKGNNRMRNITFIHRHTKSKFPLQRFLFLIQLMLLSSVLGQMYTNEYLYGLNQDFKLYSAASDDIGGNVGQVSVPREPNLNDKYLAWKKRMKKKTDDMGDDMVDSINLTVENLINYFRKPD